jgi:uridylate kinase
MVDGVYDSDPKVNPNAVKYDELTFTEVLNKELKVMDAAAASLCRENGLPILVCNLDDPQNIVRAIGGENVVYPDQFDGKQAVELIETIYRETI